LEQTTLSGLLLEHIESLGSNTIFLVPGANISSFVSQVQSRKTIDLVIANHELAAGFMAIGYAKATGKPGIACSIGSVGIAYMIGAAATAAAEQIPLLFVSGNIPRDSWGKGFFQDGSPQGTNDVALLEQAIGCSCTCSDAGMIDDLLALITERLRSKRPAHIQLTIDVQSAFCGERRRNGSTVPRNQAGLRSLPPTADLHKKTLVLIGHEAADGIDPLLLQRALARHAFGVVTDIKSRGVLDECCANSLGYVGFNSSRSALSALAVDHPLAADQLVQIGFPTTMYARYAGHFMPSTTIDAGAVNAWLQELVDGNGGSSPGYADTNMQWLRELRELSSYSPILREIEGRLLYSQIVNACQRLLPADTIYCLDSGQIRRAGNMMIKARNRQTIIQSDTLSPMGMGICAAIGAKAALPDRPVVALFGDGSMRMHGMELATAQRYRLPIIFILCDNQCLASTPGNDALKKLSSVRWDNFAGAFGVKTYLSVDDEAFTRNLLVAMTSPEPTLLWTRVPDLLDDEVNIVASASDKTWLNRFQKGQRS